MTGMRSIILAAALVLAAVACARAQQPQNASPLPTQGFLLKAVATNTLSVTTTSSRVALTSAVSPTAWVTNTLAVPACVKFGDNTVVATIPCVGSSQFIVGPGQTRALGIGGNPNLAGISAAGATTLSIVEGYLTPALAP